MTSTSASRGQSGGSARRGGKGGLTAHARVLHLRKPRSGPLLLRIPRVTFCSMNAVCGGERRSLQRLIRTQNTKSASWLADHPNKNQKEESEKALERTLSVALFYFVDPSAPSPRAGRVRTKRTSKSNYTLVYYGPAIRQMIPGSPWKKKTTKIQSIILIAEDVLHPR